ncbi:MAG: bifunctional precorrin-2 dehydrogenase/sirohydrochlorin ferrochelatase [Anaerovibrio sp.]|nr:bifunctional precorrin-2 dehydrogenase/sirohydrochlorin ferrochelatase [Anaerovibrio sp.]
MYPISMRMEGRSAAVTGGGRVALRKLRRLLEEGASVTVIAPEVLPEIEELAAAGCLVWHQAVQEDFIWQRGAFALVFAAADNPQANRMACRQAREAGALVNNATDPGDCDFFVPASIRRGELELTVGTGGGSPAFARLLRQDMEARYHEEFGDFLTWLTEFRQELMVSENCTRDRQRLWRQAMQLPLFDLILHHRLEQAKDEIRREISGAGTESSNSTGGDSGKVQHTSGKDCSGAGTAGGGRGTE